MALKSIKSIKNLKNKRVLVRCDFDVPLSKSKVKSPASPAGRQKSKVLEVEDDRRLKNCLPTINYLLKKKAKIILIGHLGRPGGKTVKSLSLKPIKEHLQKLLITNYQLPITFIPIKRYLGEQAIKAVKKMKPNHIIILENLRFSDREQKNCKKFAKNLASLADIYVNDAFSVSHRAHASINAIQKYLPSFMGLNLEEEIKNLNQVTSQPKHPLILIIGGAKIKTKLPVIKSLLKKADYILVGGGVANTFIKALGYGIGKSLIDKSYIKQAQRLTKNSKLLIPLDVILSGFKYQSSGISQVKENQTIMDIGPQTIQLYLGIIKSAKTIIWNGPLGKIEDRRFARGSQQIAKQLLKSKAKIIIGGGDTDKIFNHKKIPNNIFISSGGGAMLEFLAGKKLPGLKSF